MGKPEVNIFFSPLQIDDDDNNNNNKKQKKKHLPPMLLTEPGCGCCWCGCWMRASLSPVRKGAMCGGSMDACGCCIPDGSSASGHKTKQYVNTHNINDDSFIV